MLSARKGKLLLAAILLLALLASVFWLLRNAGGRYPGRPARAGGATNLALDLRFTYDAAIFRPASYDGTAEFPLQLDGTDFSFYGKRIRGAGKILAKEPGPILYDFVGSQHSEVFEYWYNLKPQGEPVYEDCTLQGRLGLHQRLVYLRTAESRGWPAYFPDSLRGALQQDGTRSGGSDTAYIEGWTLFGREDLYFFYAISPRALSPQELKACVAVINSMQFNAIGSDEGEAGEAQAQDPAAAEDEAASGRRKIQIDPRSFKPGTGGGEAGGEGEEGAEGGGQ